MRPPAATGLEVALVDTSGTVPKGDLRDAARALTQQVRKDFAPAWRVDATIVAHRSPPDHAWRIELRDGIDEQGAAGYHADDHRVPYAEVDLGAGDWTVTTSHELLEMLADPWGDRLRTAAALPGWSGRSPRVRYLLEVADPCEAFNYLVLGLPVTDFLLPAFYRKQDATKPSSKEADPRCSQAGSLTTPLEVAEGGYITFVDPATGDVWQRFVGGGRTEDRNYGPQDLGSAQSLREWADERARAYRAEARDRAA